MKFADEQVHTPNRNRADAALLNIKVRPEVLASMTGRVLEMPDVPYVAGDWSNTRDDARQEEGSWNGW